MCTVNTVGISGSISSVGLEANVTHTLTPIQQTNTWKSTESSSSHMWKVSRLGRKCEDRKTIEHETHTNKERFTCQPGSCGLEDQKKNIYI